VAQELEMPTSNSDSSCTFVGNSDLYGDGVRCGFYLSWIATLFTTVFDPKEETILRLLNLLVQIGLFLGLVVTDNQPHSVEPIITFWLLCGSLSSLTGDGKKNFSHFTGILRILFYTALSSYAVWFWFEGINRMVDLQPGCKAIVFFNGVTIETGFSTFGKLASIVGVLVCAVCLAIVPFSLLNRWQLGRKTRSKYRPQIRLELLGLSVTLIVMSISVVEYIIYANNITGVSGFDGIGQIVPLLVGVLSSVSTAWEIVTRRLWRQKRCWLVFGVHL
jgi:hypothetical protein